MTVGSPKAFCASGFRAAQHVREGSRVRHEPHAASAAACRRLDHDRVADPVGFRPSEPHRPGRPGTWHAGHAGFIMIALAPALSPIERIDSADGPMNTMPASAQAAEILVLSQESVAGWMASAPKASRRR